MDPGPKAETERLRRAIAAPGRPSSDYDLTPAVRAPETGLRPAGVLVLLVAERGVPSVLLTRRSSMLRHHPGQIAFAGGKQDPGDADVIAAALREAREEVALPEGAAEVLGTLPPHVTVTGFEVTPVVARLIRAFQPVPEAGEVDEVFTAPFSHVTDPARFQVHGRMWRGVERRYYTVPWGPYYIWGATARILRALADRVSP